MLSASDTPPVLRFGHTSASQICTHLWFLGLDTPPVLRFELTSNSQIRTYLRFSDLDSPPVLRFLTLNSSHIISAGHTSGSQIRTYLRSSHTFHQGYHNLTSGYVTKRRQTQQDLKEAFAQHDGANNQRKHLYCKSDLYTHLALSQALAETDCDVGNNVERSSCLSMLYLLEALLPHQSLREGLCRRWTRSPSMAYAASPFNTPTVHQASHVSPTGLKGARISSTFSLRYRHQFTFPGRLMDSQAVVPALIPGACSTCKRTNIYMEVDNYHHYHLGGRLSCISLVDMSSGERWKIGWYANVLLVSTRLLILSREMYWAPCDRFKKNRPAIWKLRGYRNGRLE